MKPRLLQARILLPALAVAMLGTSQASVALNQTLTQGPAGVLQAIISLPAGTLHGWFSRLRQSPDVRSALPPEQALRDRDFYYRLSRQYEQQIAKLQSDVEQLTHIRRMPELKAQRIVIAWVTGINTDPTFPTLTLNRGRGAGLEPEQVVVSGIQLVGRVDQVGPATASVRLITAPDTLLTARLVNAAQMGPDAGRLTLLRYDAQRKAFTAVIDRQLTPHVTVGDLAHLVVEGDRHWPEHARALLIGRVIRIEDLPENPHLQQRVMVQPTAMLEGLTTVQVIVPEEE